LGEGQDYESESAIQARVGTGNNPDCNRVVRTSSGRQCHQHQRGAAGNGHGDAAEETHIDLDQAAGQLANISTRGFVDTDPNEMIGGFIVGGGSAGQTATVLVRAIGPSLTAFGVQGALQDPTLELHDGNGNTLMTNDNWKDTQQAEIIATTIQPTDDFESAILANLGPRGYTAIVRGKNNTTGVGLVEAYNLQ
jgi:hypothetical protein